MLVFSLEMSQLEISQRILCSEARVDATRLRSGKLTAQDWSDLSSAIARMANAPIWVDDNPAVTIIEIRGKARRLKSQAGQLGLVIVDYLQLMTGRHTAENRQVEVAEISRGLKILARELECPVVALSQLSRNLEQRQDKRPPLPRRGPPRSAQGRHFLRQGVRVRRPLRRWPSGAAGGYPAGVGRERPRAGPYVRSRSHPSRRRWVVGAFGSR